MIGFFRLRGFLAVPLPLEELAKNRNGDLVLRPPGGFFGSNDIGRIPVRTDFTNRCHVDMPSGAL